MNMYYSTVSVSSTLKVVVLVRQFQPNYLIFCKKPPRCGQISEYLESEFMTLVSMY